jgi:membrane-associated phospholipid phosphatase
MAGGQNATQMGSTSRTVEGRAALAAMALLVIAATLSVLAARADTFPLDEGIARNIRGWGESYEPIVVALNDHNVALWLGATVAGVAIALLSRRGQLAAMFALAPVLALSLFPLKSLVGRPRPSGDFEVLLDASGGSFPSGSVLISACVFGMWLALASELLPTPLVWPVRALAVAVVLLTALARIGASVHWPSDTYGALVWSMAAVASLLALRPGISRLLTRRTGRALDS